MVQFMLGKCSLKYLPSLNKEYLKIATQMTYDNVQKSEITVDWLTERFCKEINSLLYLSFQNSEDELPECNSKSICNKVDLYDTPWVERQCRCTGGRTCPMDLNTDDGHTFVEKTRQYKVCEPIKKLPKCR